MNSNNKNLVIIFHGAVPTNGTNRIIFRGYNYEIDNTILFVLSIY